MKTKTDSPARDVGCSAGLGPGSDAGTGMRPYRPYSATEGDCFFLATCAGCARFMRKKGCRILDAGMLFDIGQPDFPREWVQDEHGHPTCTALRPPVPRVRRERKILGQGELFRKP